MYKTWFAVYNFHAKKGDRVCTDRGYLGTILHLDFGQNAAFVKFDGGATVTGWIHFERLDWIEE